MDELDRKLSRLALAKAIKTPLESESDIDPWNKSVIFNQPFLKDLHKPSEPTKTPALVKPVRKISSSEPNIVSEPKIQPKHTILPSDSEEDEEEEEDDEESSEESDDSQSFKISRKEEKKPMKTKPELKLDVNKTKKTRPTSFESSRGSCSSFSSPVTEEDEDVYEYPPQRKMPMMMEPDPMYLQRLYSYQQQLQYQHQLQQQQQLQQQMYFQSMFYAPPPPHWTEDPRHKRRSHPHHSRKPHKVSQTDLRRRAEMMRSSSVDVNYYRRSSYHY